MQKQPLMNLMNIPPNIVEVTKTSDGFFLGRTIGDIGFNTFLGKPSHHPGPGRDRSVAEWKRYTFGDRRRAVRAARHMGVDLAAFLGKGGAR